MNGDRSALSDSISALSRIELAEFQAAADLQTRLDRKYFVSPGVVSEVVDTLGSRLCALDIGGLRDFTYESTYFDTPALDSYFGSAHGRRRRFKVRTRSYLDSGACVLEVKTTGGRGHTVKERLDYDIRLRRHLDSDATEFLAAQNIPAVVIDQLGVTLTTRYRRSTLLGADGARFTIDAGLDCTTPHGTARLAGEVLVETKSRGAVTDLDRLLWNRGIWPVSVSKYCTGLAAVTPGLPANKWSSTLRRHFGWTPVGGALARV